MTTIIETHWLSRFTGGGSKHWMGAPFAVRIGDAVWTVATNGRVLIALLGHVADAAPNEKGSENVLPLLEPPDETHPLDWPRFKAWLGTRSPDKLCDQCGGDGLWECPTCEHESECGECDGTGHVGPDPEPIEVFGQNFNRNFFADVAQHLDAGTVAVGVTATVPEKHARLSPLVIHADAWRLVIMPMKTTAAPLAKWEG